MVLHAIEIPDERLSRELSLIETAYGRLVYLAGLLDKNTGRYFSYGTGFAFADQELSRRIRLCHESLFQNWLTLPLEDKMADVELYINTLDDVDRIELIDAWLRLAPYKNLVPASIQGPERQRHVSDVEAILGLLRNVYGVAAPDLGA
ncbi:MAG: hypothetical protein JO061_13255 [Acidobacteriaceae bacterium]|nr:hypothetical protein [Acidobacteriaceae bacterium]